MNGRAGGMKFQNRKGTPKMNNENISRSGDLSGIDLWELLRILLQRWRLLLLCTVAAAAVTLACTANFITPLYRASVMIYVNNVKSSQQVDYISASNLATSQQLVNTYVNIIQSDTVLEKVARSTDTDYTAAQIRAMMTAEQVDETELFFVYITHPDPRMAAEIANAVAEVAPGEIESFVEGSSTKIIDYAKERGATVIAITDSAGSPLAAKCDHLLLARSDMASFVDSLVAPLSLINALIVAVGMRRQKEVGETYAQLEKIWDEYDVYEKNEENIV